MPGGGRGRRDDGERSLIGRHELDRARQAWKRYGALPLPPEIPTNLTVPILVLVDMSNSGHGLTPRPSCWVLDSPSGERQRLGRGSEYPKPCAHRSAPAPAFC